MVIIRIRKIQKVGRSISKSRKLCTKFYYLSIFKASLIIQFLDAFYDGFKIELNVMHRFEKKNNQNIDTDYLSMIDELINNFMIFIYFLIK